MDKVNQSLMSSHQVHVKLENLPVPERASSSVVDHASNSTSSLTSPLQSASSFEGSVPHETLENCSITPTRGSIIVPLDSFEFKTPEAVRLSSPTKQSCAAAKNKNTILSSDSQSSTIELTPEGSKTISSSKKKPAVKIASFAKASPVDRVAPSSSSPQDATTIKDRNNSSSSFVPSSYSYHSGAGGSKQPITQTSLPTPALNAALRSFFNYSSQPEGSPCSNISHSEDEEEVGNDEDVEEEEILVYMQFDSKLDSDLLQPHTPFKIIGVDSEKPVLQLGNQVFEGNWVDTVGTAVFFEEHPSASPGDPVFTKHPPSTLSYHSKTQKALVMSRIFVKPKDAEASGPLVPMAIVEVPP